VLYWIKSRIAEKSAEMQQTARVMKLEEANALLRVELAVAKSKFADVEGCERVVSSACEDLLKDFGDMRSAFESAVKERGTMQKNTVKMERFRDALFKKLAELCRDTEASVSTLGEDV
jgi:translation initiation factor 2 alpha subunit (eIF-2alpha)